MHSLSVHGSPLEPTYEPWGGFVLLALLSGVVGLYGAIAYSVSRRTREIGVRMALGAQRCSVYRPIMKEAVRLNAFGIAGGMVCSLGVATLIRDLLFRVRSWEAETLGVVAACLLHPRAPRRTS